MRFLYQLGSTWLHFGSKNLPKSRLGGVLGRLGGLLRRLGRVLERLGLILERLGGVLERLGRVLKRPERVMLLLEPCSRKRGARLAALRAAGSRQ